MRHELKVGFTGARRAPSFGHIGSLEGVTNWALMDPDPENLARGAAALGVKHQFADFEALLESGIDALVVASPMPAHVPQSVAALERGVHVLCEVNAATNLEECQQLLDAVRASRAKYMMAENYVYGKAQQLVRGMVEAGLFGEVHYCEGAYLHDCVSLYANPDGSLTWRGDLRARKRGSTYGTHSLGPCLNWMQDRVRTVCCMGSGMHRWKRGRMDDTTVMLCQTEKGHLIVIGHDSVSKRPHNMTWYLLQGAKGCYEAARGFGDDHKVWVEDFHGEDENQWHSLWDFEAEFMPEPWRSLSEKAAAAGHGGGDYFVAYEFVRSIINDTDPPIDVFRTLDMTLCDMASQESIARGGAPVPVPNPRTDRLFPAAP